MHEFAHAFAAVKLGDDLPSREGRLTLNPIAHIDPIGTLLIPALAGILPIALFGWGKPVRTQPINYTRRFSMRAGEAIVAFAGPFSNLLMAILCSGLLVLFLRLDVISYESPFKLLLLMMARLNLVLFILNLIPIPPLDGSKIAAWALGHKADRALEAISSLGFIGLYLALALAGTTIGWLADHAFTTLIHGFSMIGS